MSRLIDQACDLEELHRAAALSRLQVAYATQETVPSALACEDCGEPIPQARREAVLGCTTCVDCQTRREKNEKT